MMNQERSVNNLDTTPISSSRKQKPNQRRIKTARRIVFFTALLISFVLSAYVIINQPQLQNEALPYLHASDQNESFERLAYLSPKKYQQSLAKDLDNTGKAITAFLPKQPYIVINTTGNSFGLFDEKGKNLRSGLVSTGSFTILKAGNDKQWMFKTPRGQLKVLRKTKDPVWKRPDWAFIEEGLKVPSANHPSRFEHGTLGDYSISLGDGYMIHGTLYKRFLGLPVTHGCIRMGDEDLEDVFNTLKMGSKVYIY